MASLLVLVAHSGRTLQLDVQASTRVDAVQHALVSFTGIPVADQIAMYQGARLDPAKLLGAYRLPVDPAVVALEDHPVFLYCRSYLKSGAALPPPEALPQLHVQVPPLAEVNLAHPLHSAPSPLVRALPDYERHFQHHLATTRAYWDVAQTRLQRCRQLLSEQEVQARAADAARANVEAHYNYILNSYQMFLDKYNGQHTAHAALLATFPADLAALEAIELHPSLHQQRGLNEESCPSHPGQPNITTSSGGCSFPAPAPLSTPGPQRLADLYPVQRLREWAETCSRSHASFGAKVSELEALFQLLRKDVEGLFMQAPSVDLDALGRQMADHEALLDEHSSMVQVLSKDLRTVRTLVEDVVRQLGSAAGGPGGGSLRQGGLHDAAAAMEAIHETHRNRVLPRLAQLDTQLACFAARVEASKVAMSRDVLSQLQRISGQQSRIRDMKNKLAAFYEVLSRQDAAFAELRVVHRLPSAYRALLAEVVRRSAWHQLYCVQAGKLAEHMARFRDKEAGRRAAFVSRVARYIPNDLLARAGLASEPPHCQVTVPPPEVPLISVAMADLQRLSYLDERMLAASLRMSAVPPLHSDASSVHHQHQHHLHRGNVVDPIAYGSHHQHQHQSQASFRLGGSSTIPYPGTVAVLDADPPPPTDSVNALEMENALLRAELADYIADSCIRGLNAATPSNSGKEQQPAAAADSSSAQQAGSAPPTSTAGSASLTPRNDRTSGGGAGGESSQSVAMPAVAGSPSAPQRRDPAEVLAAMRRALGMKDDFIRHQQRERAALASRAAAYEERIAALELLLMQRARGSDGDEVECEQGMATATRHMESSSGASAMTKGMSQAARAQMEFNGCCGQGEAGGHQPGLSEAVVNAAKEGFEGGDMAASGRPGGHGAEGSAEVVCGERDNELRALPSLAARVDTVGNPESANHSSFSMADETSDRPKGDIGLEGLAVSHDDSRDAPLPALGMDDHHTDSERPSTSPLSPFSVEAAQQQLPFPRSQAVDTVSGALPCGAEGLLSTAADLEACQPACVDDAETTSADAAAPMHGSCSGSGIQARRKSSGPQSIPQVSGGLRRGNAAPGEEPSLQYEPHVPMSIGSLPFATSLPVGSTLANRLASSPSGGIGIGIGLALGFGLASLAEAPGRMPREVDGNRSRNNSGSSRRTGDGGGGALARTASIDVEDGNPEADNVTTPDSPGVLQGSSGGASSGNLQFQPSWSAQVSGDWAIGAAGSGNSAVTTGTVDAGRDDALNVTIAAEREGGVSGSDDEIAEGGGSVQEEPDEHAACDIGVNNGATTHVGQSELGASGAALECTVTDVGGPPDHGIGNVCDDGPLAEDVPDIDEIFDSDGAWEVASEAAAASPAQAATAATEAVVVVEDSDIGVGLVAEPSSELGEGSKEGSRGVEVGSGGVQVAQGMGTSSGYESVGSDVG
ncbi:hypothetical protein VaNZ11_014129 [Volvox africanus]|uniref:Ubiquitin-like domain-containing protein n=1 Tax=Volvox africanus TaxID=51714 RepID=A0ABQ5SHR4_9CHLO|nr:hypothetical protein VaNZ11_014129 [Volvox africanus]